MLFYALHDSQHRMAVTIVYPMLKKTMFGAWAFNLGMLPNS